VFLANGHVRVSHDEAGALHIASSGKNTKKRNVKGSEMERLLLSTLRALLKGDASSVMEAVMPQSGRLLMGSSGGEEKKKIQKKMGWTSLRDNDTHPELVAARLGAIFRAAGIGAVLDGLAASLDVVVVGDAFDMASKGLVLTDKPAVLLAALDLLENLPPPARSPPPYLALSVSGNASVVVASSTPLEYVGTAVAVGDFDADGFDDAVITAPGHTALGTLTSSSSAAAAAVAAGGKTAPSSSASNSLLPQSGGFYTRYGNMSSMPANDADTAPIPEPLPVQYATFGADEFTRLGWDTCVLDFNADGIDDLAVSAPTAGWQWADYPGAPVFLYSGRVHVYFGAKGQGLAGSSPNVVFYSPFNTTFLGMSLKCADVSGDGFRDLLVGSPMALAGLQNGVLVASEAGRLDIVYSSSGYAGAGAGTAGPLMLDVTAASNLTANGTCPYEWFGYHSDTLGNASYNAAITVREILVSFGLFEEQLQLPSACALQWEESTNSKLLDLFDSPLTAEFASSTTLLLVGSPGFRNAESIAVGRLSAYAIPAAGSPLASLVECVKNGGVGVEGKKSEGEGYSSSPVKQQGGPSPLPSPLFTITADSSLAKGPTISTKLGAGFALGHPLGPSSSTSPVLALGAPAVDFCNSSSLLPTNATTAGPFNTSAGAVTLITISPTNPLRGDLLWKTLITPAGSGISNATRAVLASSLPDSHFGWHLSFDDKNGDGIDDLFVSAPMYTPFFLGRNSVKEGKADDVEAKPALRGGGAAAAALSLDESSSSTTSSFSSAFPTSSAARVGADTTDSGREAGTLFVYYGGAGTTFPSGYICDAQTLNSWRADGDVQFGRFGSSWAMVDWDGDGEKEVLVGAPRASEPIPPSAATMFSSSSRKLQPGVDPAEMPGAVYVFE
jgi:hypothetical protein